MGTFYREIIASTSRLTLDRAGYRGVISSDARTHVHTTSIHNAYSYTRIPAGAYVHAIFALALEIRNERGEILPRGYGEERPLKEKLRGK